MGKVKEHLMDLQYRVYELMEVQDGIREALKKNQEKVLESIGEILEFVPGTYKVGDRVTQLQRVRHKTIQVTKVTAYVEWKMKWVQFPGDDHGTQVRDYLQIKVSYAGRLVKKSGELSDFLTQMHTFDKYDPPMVNVIKLDGGPDEG